MKNRLRIGYPLLYKAICTPIALAVMIVLFFYLDVIDTIVFPLAMVLLALVVFNMLSFKMEFDRDEICIHYFFLFRRHITRERISSLQLVTIGSIPTLILCLDGHRRHNDFVELSFFYLSFKVIRMQFIVSQETCEEYAETLKELYGDKFIIEESYQKLVKRNKSK